MKKINLSSQRNQTRIVSLLALLAMCGVTYLITVNYLTPGFNELLNKEIVTSYNLYFLWTPITVSLLISLLIMLIIVIITGQKLKPFDKKGLCFSMMFSFVVANIGFSLGCYIGIEFTDYDSSGSYLVFLYLIFISISVFIHTTIGIKSEYKKEKPKSILVS